MDNFIKHSVESIDLSDGDIFRMCNQGVAIHEYRDLDKMDSYMDLFGDHEGAVILYETRDNFGHWVLVLNLGGNQVEFFDPLGIPVDGELGIIPDYYRTRLNEVTPHLTHLLQGVRVKNNMKQLQKVDNEINTCGRHVVCRFRLYEMGFALEEYVRLFEKQLEPADDTVSKITLLL